MQANIVGAAVVSETGVVSRSTPMPAPAPPATVTELAPPAGAYAKVGNMATSYSISAALHAYPHTRCLHCTVVKLALPGVAIKLALPAQCVCRDRGRDTIIHIHRVLSHKVLLLIKQEVYATSQQCDWQPFGSARCVSAACTLCPGNFTGSSTHMLSAHINICIQSLCLVSHLVLCT